MRKQKHRGISLGTITMLLLSIAVLTGFCMLLPTFTGQQDIRLNAAELVVAIDESFSQIAETTESWMQEREVQLSPTVVSLPSEILATALPVVVTPPPKISFSFCAGGSIILNNTIQKALTIDGSYRFDLLTDQLTGVLAADLSIATLENNYIPTEKLTHLNMPVEALGALKSTGINAVSVGHLNALNSGTDGLAATLQSIQSSGMLPYGLYASKDSSEELRLMECNGLQIALLGYQNDISTTARKQLSEEERSFAYAPIDLKKIRSDIAKAKSSGSQVVVVSLCWGKAGAASPSAEQKELAQAMADAGADIILGTHSGVVQPVEMLSANRGDGRYHPVLCAYSLGNLVTHDREKRANLTGILLKANVVYDPTTDAIAFDNLGYLPTYAWRGKDSGRTLYRILPNNGVNVPAFVDKDQKGVMDRCFNLITEVMADTAIPMIQ